MSGVAALPRGDTKGHSPVPVSAASMAPKIQDEDNSSSINTDDDKKQQQKQAVVVVDFLLPHPSLRDKPYIKPPSRRKSIWWQAYHLSVDLNQAICNVCGNALNVTHNSTSPLRNHLHIKHPAVHDALLERGQQQTTAAGAETITSTTTISAGAGSSNSTMMMMGGGGASAALVETTTKRKEGPYISPSPSLASSKKVKAIANSSGSSKPSVANRNSIGATEVAQAMDRHLAMFLVEHNLSLTSILSSSSSSSSSSTTTTTTTTTDSTCRNAKRTLHRLLEATAEAGRAGILIAPRLTLAHVQDTLGKVETTLQTTLSESWKHSQATVALACEEWKSRGRPVSLAFVHARWIDQDFTLHATTLKVYRHYRTDNERNNDSVPQQQLNSEDPSRYIWTDLENSLQQYGLGNQDDNKNTKQKWSAPFLILGSSEPPPGKVSMTEILEKYQMTPLYDVDDMLQGLVEQVILTNPLWGEESNQNETRVSLELANGYPELVKCDASDGTAKGLLSKARRVLAQFSSEKITSGTLDSNQTISTTVVMRDVVPKWWSTHDMLETLLSFKSELDQRDNASNQTVLEENEWKCLQNLVQLLSPLTCLAKCLKGCDQITASLLPLLLGAARHEMTNFHCSTDSVNRIAEEMAQYFDDLFGRIDAPYHEDSDEDGLPSAIVFAHALDPRFKDLPLVTDSSNREEIWAGLLREMHKIAVKEEEQVKAEAPIAMAPAAHNTNNNSSRSSFFARIHSLQVSRRQEKPVDALMPRLRNELTAYQTSPRMDYNPEQMTDSNPLDWWKSYHLSFPTLWKLARQHLALPITTAPAQRAFDCEGHLALMEKSQSSDMFLERILVQENMEFLSDILWEEKIERKGNLDVAI